MRTGSAPCPSPSSTTAETMLLESGRCAGKQIEEGNILPGETVTRLECPVDPAAVLAPSLQVDQKGPHEFRGCPVSGEPGHVRAVSKRAGERLNRMQLFR